LKQVLAALVTVAAIVAVLYFNRAPIALTPEDCLKQMFDAAERGDVDAYLDCFTGAERARLDRELGMQSKEAFAQSLVEAVKTLKGRAIIAPPGKPATSDRAELTVERVYAHRNETQTYRFERSADLWRIAAVETVRAFEPPVPFGTPVFTLPADDQPSR
jgi:hypothetical protein